MNEPAASRPSNTRDVGPQLALIAAIASIGLTAAAFWLSYEHLHDVAYTHGLSDPARSWAWPATVDLFILVGEILMLRGSLVGRIDPWSITLTAVGSAGSIALNVAGVGADAGGMNYVVAAVPPVAALLAFGALMRQIHGALAHRIAIQQDATQTLRVAPEPGIEAPRMVPQAQALERHEATADEVPEAAASGAPGAPQDPADQRHESATPDAPVAPQGTPAGRHEDAPAADTETPPKPPRVAPRKRPKPTSRDAAKDAIKALYKQHGRRPVESEMVAELKRIRAKYTSRQFANKLRTEIERDQPELAALGSDNVRPLTG